MVEHHLPRDYSDAPSKRITNSKHSFIISTREFEELREFHKGLDGALGQIRTRATIESFCDDLCMTHGMFLDIPSIEHSDCMRRKHSLVTTELVMMPDRSFKLVSINTFSARHLEVIASISRPDPSALTSTARLTDALIRRGQGKEIVFIGYKDGRPRYPQLAKLFQGYGLRVRHQSLGETVERSGDEWQYLLELPLLQGGKQAHRILHEKASFAIEPSPHLSSQFALVLLTRKSGSQLLVSEKVRSKIAQTYTILAKAIPDTAVIKTASPFFVQGVRRERYNQFFDDTDDVSSVMYRCVAQEFIEPLRISIKDEHDHCPVRLMIVSMNGEVLTGMAVARIPANGHPQRDTALDIVIR